MSDRKELLVIALGGNALIEEGSSGTFQDHKLSVKKTCQSLLPLFQSEYDIVLTHGNGPQVGNIIMQNEDLSKQVPPMPVDVCVAESQGEIGYFIQQELKNLFLKNNIKKEIITLITQVLVDSNDIAFEKPSKPIGPFYDKLTTQKLRKEKGYTFHADASGNKYRRVIASPKPIKIIECRIIQQLLLAGNITVAVGGGGVPVRLDNDEFLGVEAVIDKDLASARLAIDLKADKLIILTNVSNCYLNYKSDSQLKIKEMNLDEAQTYYEQGQFSSGSMGPKVLASIEYLLNGGNEVFISDSNDILRTLNYEKGTFIHH